MNRRRFLTLTALAGATLALPASANEPATVQLQRVGRAIRKRHAAISTGIPDLDSFLGGGLRRGTLTTFVGRWGSFKSSLAVAMSRRTCNSTTQKVLMFSQNDIGVTYAVPEIAGLPKGVANPGGWGSRHCFSFDEMVGEIERNAPDVVIIDEMPPVDMTSSVPLVALHRLAYENDIALVLTQRTVDFAKSVKHDYYCTNSLYCSSQLVTMKNLGNGAVRLLMFKNRWGPPHGETIINFDLATCKRKGVGDESSCHSEEARR